MVKEILKCRDEWNRNIPFSFYYICISAWYENMEFENRKDVFMNMEKFEELVKTKSNFEKIRKELWNFVEDIDNLDFDDLDTELNEVLSANLDSMDINGFSDLEIMNSSFTCVVKITGCLDIEDKRDGENIPIRLKFYFMYQFRVSLKLIR